jgi:hypothetical protein
MALSGAKDEIAPEAERYGSVKASFSVGPEREGSEVDMLG